MRGPAASGRIFLTGLGTTGARTLKNEKAESDQEQRERKGEGGAFHPILLERGRFSEILRNGQTS